MVKRRLQRVGVPLSPSLHSLRVVTATDLVGRVADSIRPRKSWRKRFGGCARERVSRSRFNHRAHRTLSSRPRRPVGSAPRTPSLPLPGSELPGAPWKIVLTEEVRQRLSAGAAPPDWVGLSEASRRLGLSKSHVAYLVKAGKLQAVHTTVRNRRCDGGRARSSSWFTFTCRRWCFLSHSAERRSSSG